MVDVAAANHLCTFKAAVSDHCPIEVEIPINTHDSNSRNHFGHKLNPLPPVVLWDENSIAKYGETLMRPEIHKSINVCESKRS